MHEYARELGMNSAIRCLVESGRAGEVYRVQGTLAARERHQRERLRRKAGATV